MSARSDRRGLSWRVLPREGFQGVIPVFPFPEPTARELEVWGQLWATPQAIVWAEETWRLPSVATYTRLSVRAESADCPASVLGQWLRLADQLGISPAGLRENFWTVAPDEVAERRAEYVVGGSRRLRAAPTDASAPPVAPVRRMRGGSSLERARRVAEGDDDVG